MCGPSRISLRAPPPARADARSAVWPCGGGPLAHRARYRSSEPLASALVAPTAAMARTPTADAIVDAHLQAAWRRRQHLVVGALVSLSDARVRASPRSRAVVMHAAHSPCTRRAARQRERAFLAVGRCFCVHIVRAALSFAPLSCGQRPRCPRRAHRSNACRSRVSENTLAGVPTCALSPANPRARSPRCTAEAIISLSSLRLHRRLLDSVLDGRVGQRERLRRVIRCRVGVGRRVTRDLANRAPHQPLSPLPHAHRDALPNRDGAHLLAGA